MSAFDSLTLALEGWFDKPLCDLPDALHQRIEDDFWPMPWDRLSAEGRRGVTQQIDFENDPATESFRHFCWDNSERRISVTTQISAWEAVATPTALDLAQQQKRLAELRQELVRIEAEVFLPGDVSGTGEPPDAFPGVKARMEAELRLQDWHRQNARNAANKRHDQPGGSRDKQSQIREIWARGNYSSRDICAEQECSALDMSFAAARKALKNTPNPIRD